MVKLYFDKSEKQLKQGQKYLPQVIHCLKKVQDRLSHQQQLVQDKIKNDNVSKSEAKLLTMTLNAAQVK